MKRALIFIAIALAIAATVFLADLVNLKSRMRREAIFTISHPSSIYKGPRPFLALCIWKSDSPQDVLDALWEICFDSDRQVAGWAERELGRFIHAESAINSVLKLSIAQSQVELRNFTDRMRAKQRANLLSPSEEELLKRVEIEPQSRNQEIMPSS